MCEKKYFVVFVQNFAGMIRKKFSRFFPGFFSFKK